MSMTRTQGRTRALISFVIIALLACGAKSVLKNSIDLGNMVVGDELYIDAETFVN